MVRLVFKLPGFDRVLTTGGSKHLLAQASSRIGSTSGPLSDSLNQSKISFLFSFCIGEFPSTTPCLFSARIVGWQNELGVKVLVCDDTLSSSIYPT